MYELIISGEDGRVLKRFDLSRVEASHRRLVIGRAEDCDIRINSPAVSRHHLAIEPDEGEWIVRDLGSTLGCVVEGVKIDRVDVRAGLVVKAGPVLLKFACGAEGAAGEGARAQKKAGR